MYIIHSLKWTNSSISYSIYSPIKRKSNFRRFFTVAVIFAVLVSIVELAVGLYWQHFQNTTEANLSNSMAVHALASSEQMQKPLNNQDAILTAAKKNNKKNNNSSSQVQSVLQTWVASHSPQQWSVVVQGLGDNKTMATINADTVYDPAGISGLFFSYPLLQQYSFNYMEKHFVTTADKGAVSIKDCLENMIENSDNSCELAIANRVGWNKTAKALNDIGLSNTGFSGRTGLTTSATDVNVFLQKLSSKQLLPADARQYLISLMYKQSHRDGIAAGCQDCAIADETGGQVAVRHDVAIVQYNGGSYTLVIMTNGASYQQIAQLTGQIQAAISSKR